MKKDDYNLIKKISSFGCIYYIDDILLSSGKTSNIYYDIKKCAGYPELFSYIVECLSNIIPKESSIVGVLSGGVPFATALAFKYNTNFAYIRQSKKLHGMENIIEGVIDYKKEIYLIDDVCTSGKSILNAKKEILKANKDAKCHLVSVVNRKENSLDIESLIEI